MREKERKRETEKQRIRETEKERNRETEKQRNRETGRKFGTYVFPKEGKTQFFQRERKFIRIS
jgi:hypothetical protein